MTYQERVVRQRTTDPGVDATGETVVTTGETVVTTDAPAPAGVVVERTPSTSSEVVDRTTVVRPSGGEMARRFVVLIFGIVQVLIVLRIALLLLNAREGNDLVSFILNASQVFVAPFIGIFNRDALAAGGSILDIAAIAALVGWTILEWIVLWAVSLFRRETVV
jgi:hypothetical protein